MSLLIIQNDYFSTLDFSNAFENAKTSRKYFHREFFMDKEAEAYQRYAKPDNNDLPSYEEINRTVMVTTVQSTTVRSPSRVDADPPSETGSFFSFFQRKRTSSNMSNSKDNVAQSNGLMYPHLDDVDEITREANGSINQQTLVATEPQSEWPEVQLKELWEKGMGVHTGFLKSFSMMQDQGGETAWRKGFLELQLPQLKFQDSTYSLRNAEISIDKNSFGHPHTLLVLLVNGKRLKISFKDAETLNKWMLILKRCNQ